MALCKLEIKDGKILKMDPDGDYLAVADVDNTQFSTIKSWGKMKWDKGRQVLYGIVDMELLDKLAGIVRLPPNIEMRRQNFHAVQDAVDRERLNKTPNPFVDYPVKMPLYSHQVRGANMCLLTFGWVQLPKGDMLS